MERVGAGIMAEHGWNMNTDKKLSDCSMALGHLVYTDSTKHWTQAESAFCSMSLRLRHE